MKKKISIMIIAIIMVIVLIVTIMVINSNNKSSTIEGTVLEVNKTNILINESGYENGHCYLIISDNTEIYVDSKKVDISGIEIGQTIQAVYVGGIEESYPGKINKVTKITVE